MKVLMLGWEFPPFYAGGVGIICYELTKALMELNEDIEITYIMPFGPRNTASLKELQHLKMLVANNEISDSKISITIKTIPVMFQAYMTPDEYDEEYEKLIHKTPGNESDTMGVSLYGKNLYLEVERFAQKVREIAKHEQFDVIHAHDWMTIPAGLYAKEVSGKPLIIHVHNTVYDRYLGKGGEHERAIEWEGYHRADLLISISNYPVSDHLINKYHVDPAKIRVVHNATGMFIQRLLQIHPYDIAEKPEKLVSYMGRVVMQKGPEIFVQAGIKALEHEPRAHFLVAGEGHLVPHLREMVRSAGVEDKFTITGKQYNKIQGNEWFEKSDIFIMPSPSEPFGLVAIEALAKGTPIIISKQSGIAEVMDHCFKVDYWDVDEMANKIVSLLRYSPLHAHMRDLSFFESKDKFLWEEKARQIYNVYKEAIWIGNNR